MFIALDLKNIYIYICVGICTRYMNYVMLYVILRLLIMQSNLGEANLKEMRERSIAQIRGIKLMGNLGIWF